MSQQLDILIHELNLSGAPRTAQEVANHMAQQGWQVRMVVIGKQAHAESILTEQVKTEFLEVSKRGIGGRVAYILKAIFKVFSYLRKEKPTMLMTWGKEFSVVCVIATRLLRLRTKLVGVNISMIERHLKVSSNPITLQLKRFVYRQTMPLIPVWIAQSSGLVDEMTTVFDIPQDSVKVVYPALQKRFFEEPLALRNEKSFVFVGRLTVEKDPERLLRNCKAFLENNPDWVLHLLGDGKLRRMCEIFADTQGIGRQVIFHGRVRDVIPYIQKAKALLLTSRFEGFGMVLAEACALGVPALSINCPSGPSEIIVSGQNGYLAETDTMFKSMLEDIAKEPMPAAQVREAVKRFHPSQVLAAYEAVLTHVAYKA